MILYSRGEWKLHRFPLSLSKGEGQGEGFPNGQSQSFKSSMSHH